MKSFIDEHQHQHRVEQICRLLQIAPPAHYLHAARCADQAKRSVRVQRDDALLPEIQCVWLENRQI